jgi:lysozyme
MSRKLSKAGLVFVKGWETFVPHVYDDLVPPVRGRYREWAGKEPVGTLTIGYGHTDAAKHPLKIKKGLRITEAEACEILDVDLDDCEKHVNKVVKVPLTQGQFDALVSLSFNLGPLNTKAKTLLNRLNAGDYDGARAAFDLYVRSKGRVLAGLQRRRDGEQRLWDEGEVETPEYAVEHVAEIDAVNPPSMLTSKEGVTIAGAGTLDAMHTGNEVLSVVSNIKENAEDAGAGEILVALLDNPTVLFGLVVLIALAVLFYWRWKRRRKEAA